MLDTTRSEEAFRIACRVIPGGVDSPVRAARAVGRNPVFLARGQSTYNYKISGIKAKDGGSYTTVSGKFKVPASTKIIIDDIEYDAEDREVAFSFKNKVQWKSPKVTIKNAKGTTVKTRILDKDNDEIEVKAKLKEGSKYSYSISGIKAKGASSYKTIKGTFRAIDD